MNAFTPANVTVSVSASGTSAVASGTVSAELPTLEINNAGTATAFVRWGVGPPTAVVTDYPILPGHCKRVNKGTATNIAAITAGASTLLYFTPGAGNV